MYSLPREERYKPFALKCLWLEKIRSCNSPASCKLFKLFGLVQFSCLSSFVSVSHSTWPGIFPAFYYPLSYVPFSIIENMSHRLVILHPNICGFDSGTTSQLILDSQPQGMFSTTPCSLFNIYLPLIPVSPCLICSPSWNWKRTGIRAACHILNPIIRQGLNLYECFIQMASNLRNFYLSEPSYIFFPSQPFYIGKQIAVRNFEIQGKLEKKKQPCSILVLGS